MDLDVCFSRPPLGWEDLADHKHSVQAAIAGVPDVSRQWCSNRRRQAGHVEISAQLRSQSSSASRAICPGLSGQGEVPSHDPPSLPWHRLCPSTCQGGHVIGKTCCRPRSQQQGDNLWASEAEQRFLQDQLAHSLYSLLCRRLGTEKESWLWILGGLEQNTTLPDCFRLGESEPQV